MICPHCQHEMMKSRDGQVGIIKTRAIILHKASGEVEINCDSCRKGVILPLTMQESAGELRKALPRQKHMIRRE